MAVTNPVTTTGVKISVSAATPASFDSTAFGNLTWTLVPDMVTWPEVGDDHARQSYTSLLYGTIYVNGPRDGGDRQFTMRYEKTDAGQIILRTANGSSSPVSIKIEDPTPDGSITYLWGTVGGIKDVARDGSVKMQTGNFAANRQVVVV